MSKWRARRKDSQRAAPGFAPVIYLISAAVLALTASCAKAPRWVGRDDPSPAEAAILIESKAGESARKLIQEEVPEIPIRKRLRPCCAFGTGLKVRVGAVPVPGFRIGNIIGPEEVGTHTYDSGAMTRSSQAGYSGYRHRESNGLIYTCRGGFIDTAHVRDYVDWTTYLASALARNLSTGTTVEFPDEGGQRRIVSQPIDQDAIDRLGIARIAAPMAQWIGFQLSIWHEIATWFGWSWTKTFPETASSFSPEDLYSNALGVKLFGALVPRSSARTEYLYNSTVDSWLAAVLEHLGPVPRSVGVEAMRSVDQHWWDSNRRLPDKELTLRRNFDIDDQITPWLVTAGLAPESLREICGDDPRPVTISIPDGMMDLKFSDWVSVQIEVGDSLAAQAPFTEIGRSVTQADFPRIIKAIREQNREEFGPDADRPD
jgi:hypothetical protein